MQASPQDTAPTDTPAKRRWQDILFNRRNLICLFQGFSSGLPLYVLVTLVPAWLRTEGIDLSTIGLLSLVTLPYTLKFVWSPLLDRYRPPFLGRRRGWTLITQVLLLIRIGLLGNYQPAISIQNIAILMFSENTDETRRLLRVINAIKDERGVADQPATATESKAE